MREPKSLTDLRGWRRAGKHSAYRDDPPREGDANPAAGTIEAMLTHSAQGKREETRRKMHEIDEERAKVRAELNREQAAQPRGQTAARIGATRRAEVKARLDQLNAARLEAQHHLEEQINLLRREAQLADAAWRESNRQHRSRPFEIPPTNLALPGELLLPFPDPLDEP